MEINVIKVLSFRHKDERPTTGIFIHIHAFMVMRVVSGPGFSSLC